MYLIRHFAYIALTGLRKAHRPEFWLRGVWIWLGGDLTAWLVGSIGLVVDRSRQVECECCGWRGHSFFTHTYISEMRVHRFAEEICPRCEALGRQRQLVRYLSRKTSTSAIKRVAILDVGPGTADLRLFSRLNLKVITVDVRPGAAMVMMDATRLALKDHAFDVVVCSHVLEHVPDDLRVLQEIHRVLKPGGFGVIQVPIQMTLSRTIEYGRPNPEEFGHVRAYGQDFSSRLEESGFVITSSEEGLFEVSRASS